MAGFKQVITTNKGQNVLASLLAEEKTVKFTKICTSSKIYEDAEIKALNNLENIKQTIPITNVTIENSTIVKITATINNLDLTEDYNICSIGIYIKVDNAEYLYALANTDSEETSIFMPKKNNNVITKFDISLSTIITNADSIDFEINPTGFASQNDIENVQSEINANKLKTYTTTLAKTSWVLNETTNLYEYNVTKEDITANHIVTIDPASFEDREKYSGNGMVNSYNGGFKIEVAELPESDINVMVSYQLSTDVTPPTENSEVSENAGQV